MKSPRWRIRNWSIRAKIVALLVPPLVSLVGFWIFATSLSLGSALNLLATQRNYEQAGKPAEAMLSQVQHERRLSLIFLGGGRADGRALVDQRKATDAAVANFRRHTTGKDFQDIATAETKRRLADTSVALDGLVTGRQAIDFGQLDRPGAMRLYTGIVERVYRVYTSLPGIEERGVNQDSRTIIQLSRAREVLSQEDAYLNGVAAAGKASSADLAQFSELVGTQRFLYADAVPDLPDPDRQAYQRILDGDAASRLRAMEDKIMTEARPNAPLPVEISGWRSAYDSVTDQLRTAEFAAGEGVVRRGTPFGVRIIVRLVISALLGLVAVAVSILLSVRIGRSLVRRLTGLRQAAQDMADQRLPEVVARLRGGADVDVAYETQPLEFGTDEIGDVGEAFNAVQRTAVESAVQQAQLRRGLNEVFLNIARRSQTLLHRQLSLLDRMERRSSDPEELEDLFRVDHLATRMRRHAEDLVILAGAAPGRGWRNPVPMVDVIRGAVSEVEDYARVRLLAMPEAALVGRAVADVIHLLAEVVENATSYSPPHTWVQIGGQLVPNGFAIEIEDRGLGMTPEAIEEANRRLRHPPDFDPANSARLGLFVVSLLAARHRIRVTLRTSPYGGVTAVVLVPPELIAGAADDAATGPITEHADVLTLSSGEAVRSGQPEAAGVRQRAAIGPGTRQPPGGSPTARPEGNAAPADRGAAEVGDRDSVASGERGSAVLGDRGAAASEAGSGPAGDRGAAAPGEGGSAASGEGGSAASGEGGSAAPVTGVVTASPAAADRGTTAVVELTDDGLPKRRRQASLAPQLRTDGAIEPEIGEPAPETPADRSPERVRAMMTSFQAGLLRGRRDAAAEPVGAAGLGAEPGSDAGSTGSGRT